MSIKFEKIKVGDTLYDRRRGRAGNTMMRILQEWTVQIIDVQNDSATVRWNGNRPEVWPRFRLEKLFSWSMYGADAVRTEGLVGTISVRRKPKAVRIEVLG